MFPSIWTSRRSWIFRDGAAGEDSGEMRRGWKVKIFRRKNVNDRELFDETIRSLEQDPDIRKMSEFSQHSGNNTLQHVKNVADVSFRTANRLGIDVDESALARGAMLHDYYLYSTKDESLSGYKHGVSHPKTALRNAAKKYILTDREANIIRSHMWPLTLLHPPRCKEAVLVSLADKYCAANEMLLKRHQLTKKTARKG